MFIVKIGDKKKKNKCKKKVKKKNFKNVLFQMEAKRCYANVKETFLKKNKDINRKVGKGWAQEGCQG